MAHTMSTPRSFGGAFQGGFLTWGWVQTLLIKDYRYTCATELPVCNQPGLSLFSMGCPLQAVTSSPLSQKPCLQILRARCTLTAPPHACPVTEREDHVSVSWPGWKRSDALSSTLVVQGSVRAAASHISPSFYTSNN